MAVALTNIAGPNLRSTANNGANVAYTTASWTPVAGRGYFIGIKAAGLTTGPDPTVTGNGQTWVKVDARQNARYLGIFKVDSAVSPSAGALSVSFSEAATMCSIDVIEVTGHNTSGMTNSNHVVNNGSGTSGSVTMGAFADANSATYALFDIVANEAMTPNGSMTELTDAGNSGPVSRMASEWAAGNISSPSYSWTSSVGWDGIGVEVLAASTTQTVTPGALGGASIPAPSVLQQVVISLLGGASIPAPTIKQTVVVAALGGASIPAPTISQVAGNQTVTPAALGGATIPQPSINQKVVMALLGGASVPAPTITQKVALSLLGGASVPAPSITQKVLLAALGGATVPAPSIKQTVAVAVLGGATLQTPVIVAAQVLAPGVLGGAVLLEPVIGAGGTVTLSDIAAYVAAVLDVDVHSVTVIDLPYYGVSLSDS